MKAHCSNDDAGVPHVRLTLGARWIEIEHDSCGWAWTTSSGEVYERATSAVANAAVARFIAGEPTTLRVPWDRVVIE